LGQLETMPLEGVNSLLPDNGGWRGRWDFFACDFREPDEPDIKTHERINSA